MANSLVRQLYDTVLGGAQAPVQGGSTFVVLEAPTRPVDALKLAGLSKVSGAGEGSAELELFSRMVDDDTPLISSEWRSSGVRLADAYSTMLMANPSGSVQDVKFAEARKLFDAMTIASVIQPGVNFQPSWPNPISWAGVDSAGLWTSQKIEAKREDIVKGSDSGTVQFDSWPDIAELMAQSTSGSDHDFSPTDRFPRIERRMSFGDWRPNDLSGFLDFGPIGESNVLGLVDAVGVDRSMERPIFDPDDPRGGGPLGPKDNPIRWPLIPPRPLPQLEPSDPPIVWPKILKPSTPPPAQAATPAASLKFDYLHVSITRRWLNGLILRFPGWSLPGFPAGFFSNGMLEQNSGKVPLLPTSFIAIKNLNIVGSWSAAEADEIYRRLNSRGSATFGPFTLSAFGNSLGSFDGSTLSIPGISILAWYCSVLPLLPPSQSG